MSFLAELAKTFNLQARVEDEVAMGIKQANIFIYPEGEAPQELVLQGHLDTVDPGSFALWSKTSYNPFQASIRGESIYGLGAAEVKLDILAKLYALAETDWTQMTSSALFLGTFGEEERMRGALRAVSDEFLTAKYALVGEPTDLNVVYAGKGIAHIEIIIPYAPDDIDFFVQEEVISSTQSQLFQGRSAHSSNPQEGENAVVKMLNYIATSESPLKLINVDGGTTFNTIPTQAELEYEVDEKESDPRPAKLKAIYNKIQQLEREFEKFPNEDFNPPTPTINIGKVRTLPDHIQIMGVVRWSSHISDREYVSWMKDLAQTCRGVDSVFRILDVKRPFATSTNGRFAKTCLEVAEETCGQSAYATQPVTNEANVFHQYGFETLVFGPGTRAGNIHTPDEHIRLADLEKAKEFYKKIIKKVCQ